MKKILCLVLVSIGLALSAQAQRVEVNLVSQYGATVDTVDNTETIYLSIPTTSAAAVKNYFKGGMVVFKALEISGTGGGTATLEASANGTDFATLPGSSAYTIVDQVAAQTTAWSVSGWHGKALRIKITGAGTMSYKVYGSAVLKN